MARVFEGLYGPVGAAVVRLLPKLANAVRLQPRAPAYNLSGFLRTQATPGPIKDVDENVVGEIDQDWREGRRPRPYAPSRWPTSPLQEICSTAS